MPLCRYPLTLRLRYSRVRGRRQSKFLASSSTGGARNFYPTGFRAVFQYASCARPPKALTRRARLLFQCRGAGRAHIPAAKPRLVGCVSAKATPPALAVPRRFSRGFAAFLCPFPAALPHFYALFPPSCISYHTKMQIYDDILCPASFFCGGAADRRPPTADHRPPTADRKKALPFREAPFGTIQLHQPGGQVMSRPAST